VQEPTLAGSDCVRVEPLFPNRWPCAIAATDGHVFKSKHEVAKFSRLLSFCQIFMGMCKSYGYTYQDLVSLHFFTSTCNFWRFLERNLGELYRDINYGDAMDYMHYLTGFGGLLG